MSNNIDHPEPTAAAGLASAIAKHAEGYGINIAPLCTSLGIDPAQFSDISSRISIDRICRLMEACAVISGDEAFGLKCASIFTLGSTGPFGYGLMTAPDFRAMVTFLCDNIQFASEVDTITMTADSRGIEAAWTFSPLILKRDQFVDMSVALIFRHVRSIVGEKSDRVRICLERPPPESASVFRQLLSKQISYAHPRNILFFPAALLDLKNPRADQRLFEMMSLLCRQMIPESRQATDFITRVRQYVQANTERGTDGIGDIARHFNISQRTLQRRLAESGYSLQNLKDEERRQLGFRLVTSTDLPFSEVAYRLGYSAQSALTRSFLRWFSASPSQLRESAR
ncbi:AraC family transcriptional regulator ligand-binding domain-containing protein [Rhizobium sp. PAMB 3174]